MTTLIKNGSNHYRDNTKISKCRERTSTIVRSPSLEDAYKRKFKMEDYALYRKQEIDYIYQYINFYKNKNEILYLLSRLCSAYNENSSFALLESYLLPVLNKSDFNSTNVIKYSLSIDKYAYNYLNNYVQNTEDTKIDKNSKMILKFIEEDVYTNCMTVKYLRSEVNNIYYLWFTINNIEISLNHLYAIVAI